MPTYVSPAMAAELLPKVRRILVVGCSGRWVMDGSSPSSFDLRVPRAELVLWIRLPRRVALLGLARRVWRNHGRVRIAMADGCPEPIPDWDFLSYIWHFERKSAPKFIAQFDRYGPDVPVAVLRSRAQVARLLHA